MVAVPQRLEDAVGEAQHQDVLDRFFAEEVIDPIDLVFGQHLEDLRVEGLGRCKVVPERLLDDHPPPRSLRLPGRALRGRAARSPGRRTGRRPPDRTSALAVLVCRPPLGQQFRELADRSQAA